MNADLRVFVALDNLPDDLVPAVRDALATWQADRPHLTDVDVVRWTAPNTPTAAGLYVHGLAFTVGDVIAVREALAPYGTPRVSITEDTPAAPAVGA